MPNISIIIPTYNRGHLILETLESVFAQTYQDFEVIVVDDGSTDNTEQILSKYMERIRFFRQENSGPSVARNLGIFNAKGAHIAFLDSDDLWYPSKLEKQVAIFESNPKIGLVYCDCSRGPTIQDLPVGWFTDMKPPSGNIFDRLVNDNLIWTPTVLVRKDIFIHCGVFDTTLRGAEDYDLWLRIAFFFECFFIQEVLCHIRDHAGRTVKTMDFSLDQSRAFEIQYNRWSFLPGFQSKFKHRVAATYFNSADAARKAGDYYNAYLLMKKGCLYSSHTIRNSIKMMLYLLCPHFIRWFDSRKRQLLNIL